MVSFNDFYNALLVYKEEHGDLFVPTKYTVGSFKLGNKVSYTRRHPEVLSEEEFKKLCDKMNESFKNGDRALNRARMAAVLGVLPVFFNSKTEVMNYVRESLMNCSNSHEKNVAISNILSSDLYRYLEE